MNNLEATIEEIEELVSRALSPERDFIEPKLRPVIFELLDTDVEEPYIERVQDVLEKIARMDKSTIFGGEYYKKLASTNLPCAEEVIRVGVYEDPIYNVRDTAVISYAFRILRNNGVSEEVVQQLEGLKLSRHGGKFEEKSELAQKLITAKIEVSDEAKEALLYAATQREFAFAGLEALQSIVYLGITELVQPLRKLIFSQMEQRDGTDDPVYFIGEIATALRFLDGTRDYTGLSKIAREYSKAIIFKEDTTQLAQDFEQAVASITD